MLIVDNIAALSSVTGLTDGQVTRLLGATTAFDDQGAELFYRATGRSGITVDSTRYFTAGGADDYFEAFFTRSTSAGSGGNLYAADETERDALFSTSPGVLAGQEIIVPNVGNYIMLTDYLGPFSGASEGTEYQLIEAVDNPKITSQGPMLDGNGLFIRPLVIGDAYNVANGNILIWIVEELVSETIGACGCNFGVLMQDRNGDTVSQMIVAGVLTDEGGGFWKTTFDVKSADTVVLQDGWHIYSVELVDSAGEQSTRVGGSTDFATENFGVAVVHKGTN